MTGRFLTLAVALTLSASLAYAGQARQRFPGGSGQSSGSQGSGQSSSGKSSSGQSSGGQGSGRQSSGGQAVSRSTPPPSAAPAPAPAPRSGGTQLQRWGTSRSEPTPSAASAPRQEPGGGSVFRRLGASRAEQSPTASATPGQESSGGTVFQRSGASLRSSTPDATPRAGGSQLQRWGVTRDTTPDTATPAQPSTPSQPSRVAVPRIQTAPFTTTSPSIRTFDDDTLRAGTPSPAARVAQPRQRYPDPDDSTRVAVPRGSVPSVLPSNPQPSGGTIVYNRGTQVYTNHYYYPRHNYPHGYGSYGLGYFYYDPYGWYDPYPVYYPGPTYTGGYYSTGYGYATGEIRLQVRPRDAEVYVDGFYAGRVDEFDGFVQSLRLEEGPHTIEIVAPGYEPLVFSVRIVAGRKINYRRDLLRYR